MILETLSVTGTLASVGVPLSYVWWRAEQVLKLRKAGIGYHEFDAHIRRDITGKVPTNWCDVCRKGRKAWVHNTAPKPELAHGYTRDKAIRNLERVDIKWRFENDPEWAKIFGDEYDPETGDPIPQFHNGECGGPHDSCERCAWEADQREAEKKERRRKQEQALYAEKHTTKEKSADLLRQEMRGYLEILQDIWDDFDGFQDAHEEWEDIRNEIGMLKNDRLRRDIKDKEPFKRLAYFFDEKRKLNWNRREEIWQDKLERDRRKYDHYRGGS